VARKVTAPGVQPGADVGPLINEAAVEKVTGLVDDAVAQGAQVLTGGSRLDRPGHFFEPTVLTGVSGDARVVTEEIFGPVAPIVAFGSDDEAYELANGTRSAWPPTRTRRRWPGRSAPWTRSRPG
jgi:succinate-semialdehyde dehydrogenase/glutarate-semialdehyde dehydrogenase